MPSLTSPSGLIYPLASDPIAPLNAIFQDLAESTQAALVSAQETAPKTANYTLGLGDVGLIVVMNVTGGGTLTVPTDAVVDFPVGSIVGVFNVSSSSLTVAGDSGVTVLNAGTVAQYGEVKLRKRAVDEWVMV
jgi:protein involved in polysaccharide export with SLBB domain